MPPSASPMQALAGPFYIAAVLLIVGGAPKLLDPAATGRAMGSVGLPRSDSAARSLGFAEIGIGAYGIATGSALAAALIVMAYLGFVGFLLLAMQKGGAASSCGCFGSDDTPPSVAHLLVNVAAAGVAAGAIVWPPGGLVSQVSTSPVPGVVFVVVVAIGSWLGYLALSVLPTVVPREGRT